MTSAAEDFPEIARLPQGIGCLILEDLEEQAQKILAEVDDLRERVGMYFRMYMDAGGRYRRVTDLVFQHLAAGDVLSLLEDVGNIANGCDYVDEDTIALFDRAKAHWGGTSEATPSDEGQVGRRVVSWQHMLLIVWLSLEAVAHILTIGKERKPRTPVDAVGSIAAFVAIAALAVTG